MATDPFELYPVIAQIAGAFAGFGSLASGLGQRRGGDDAKMDAYRLEHMLEASLSATLLGLLPATFSGLVADESWGVRASAFVALVAILVYAPRSMVHARKIRHVAGFSIKATIVNIVCMWGAFIAFALCLLGVSAGRSANLYLLGLMGMLGSTVMLFSRVIVSMLQPHHNAEDSR
jgi:hypothetical protein